MGFYAERILPRIIDLACGNAEIAELRREVAGGLTGTVVEIGFGSGLNMAAYPDTVTEVLAVEPAERARQIAGPRIRAAGIPVEHIGLDGETLPLDDESCDGALCTFTLCTIPDAGAALAEVLRVLKPDGRFHFLEHGLSPDPKVARWQHRLDPIEKKVAGGCHLTRRPDVLVADAGFAIDHLEAAYGKGPKPWTWVTSGRAHKPLVPCEAAPPVEGHE